jgi:MFS family permease
MATANPAGPAIYRFFIFTWLWSFYLWMPIWLVFLQGRGLTLTQIGVLDAFGWVLQSVAELPTGALADLYGRKVSMALGAFLLGAGLLAVQSEPLSILFLLGYMIWGVSHTFIGGADSAFLYDSLKAAGREGEYTRLAGQYSAVMWTAQATAAVAGGFLATVDPALCFTVSAALALVAAGLALTLKEPPREATAARRDVRPLVGTLRNGILFALGHPQVRYPLVLGSIISTFAFFLTFMVLQPYARTAGLPYPALGLLVLMARAAGTGGALLAGWAGRLTGPLTAGSVSSAVVIGCLGLMTAGPTFGGLLALLAITAVTGLVRPILSHEVNRWTPSERRATVLSVQGLLFTLILVVLDPLVFGVADRFGLPTALGLMTALFILLAGPLVAGWNRAGVPAARQAQPGESAGP